VVTCLHVVYDDVQTLHRLLWLYAFLAGLSASLNTVSRFKIAGSWLLGALQAHEVQYGLLAFPHEHDLSK
jgi:hypothetical protein